MYICICIWICTVLEFLVSIVHNTNIRLKDLLQTIKIKIDNDYSSNSQFIIYYLQFHTTMLSNFKILRMNGKKECFLKEIIIEKEVYITQYQKHN